MKNLIGILILKAMLFTIPANAETYYVSPAGSDSNPGTIDKPFASWQKLSSVLQAGDIAYIRGGTYRTPKAIGNGNYPVDWRNFNGTSSAHITVSAYPGESPVLNLDNIVETTFMLGFYLANCSYIDFKGLRITGLNQNPSTQNAVEGWYIDKCNQVTFTQCEVDHIQGPGYRVTQATPVSNVITFTNCDAHHNGDPYNTGGGVYGNADGFDANGGTVTYIGCRAWWNSDDGFDTFYNDAQITYSNCWSFWNGFIPGTFTDPGSQADGMGFKWGATTSDLRTTHLRTFTNCIAFQNKTWGFDQNVAKCIAWFYNNTSYQNGFKNASHPNGTGGGWAMGYNVNPPVASILKNNISYNDPTAVSNMTGLSHDHNTWNNLSASNSSFASLDTIGVTRSRQSDGSPPTIQFLHLSGGSNLINAGVPIANLSFSGSAPDLGAFEYGNSTPANQPPIANAGKSMVIALPTSIAILDAGASRDTDGDIESYNWSQISGPSSANILTLDSVKTNVTKLIQGVYRFELLVKDNKGAKGKDTVTITVHKAKQLPIANAGSDISITLPKDNVTLKGSVSDHDGTVSSYQWDQISGPPSTIQNPQRAQTVVTNLVQGVYKFELIVKDHKGAKGKDTVTITVHKANQLPIANAGSDISITLPKDNVTLKGSVSDHDGTVSSYQWDQISGPPSTIQNPQRAQTVVTNLVQGVYKFELMVKDDKGAKGKDTVTITVHKANQLPIANAGSDISITLPKDNVTLKGSVSDHDGTVSSYQWDQISGPPSTIQNPQRPQTVVTNLVQGVYKFELIVKDDKGAKGKDTVTIAVHKANQLPIANAGSDISITLPKDNVTLKGSESDHDGTVSSYQWDQISGPPSTIQNPQRAQTVVTNLVQGVYKFELMVKDDKGAKGKDTVTITVHKANQLPIANAGSDISITLPKDNVTLKGSVSDHDGTVSSYQWDQISGQPSTIQNPQRAQTVVTNLVQGVYKFELMVKDDKGAKGKDTVIITVHKANQLPIANAGSDISITLPKDNVTLKGSVSDHDGTVSSYQWNQISGTPSTIQNPQRAQTVVTNLVEGVYKFELIVKDDKGAKGKDTVTITVHKANQLPIANAGSDISITLPKDNVTLKGSGSDHDGTVSSYQWDQISGPPSTIQNPQRAQTVVTNLEQGVYVFELEVKDNQSGVGRDTVELIVARNQTENEDSVSSNRQPELVAVYPNPVFDKFSLDISNASTGKMAVGIVNQAGAEVSSFIFNKDQQKIHIDVPAKNLPSGIYFVRIKVGIWTDVRKIVKL